MGILDDKKYEELDWISKAVEPIRSDLNDVLAKLPDEVVFDYTSFVESCSKYGMLSFDKGSAIAALINNLQDGSLGREANDAIYDCFELILEEDTVIDFEAQTLNKPIILRKTKFIIDDDVLKGLLGRTGRLYLDNLMYLREEDQVDASKRLNDIVDLMCPDALKSRSWRKKVSQLSTEYSKIMKENLWNIRDVGLSDRIGNWIYQYVRNGNLAAYMNFCKLKAMTHRGLPIYSIEEENV
jgi:hypothetical protein